MKEVRVWLSEEQCKSFKEEAVKSEISLSQYIRLKLSSQSDNQELKTRAELEVEFLRLPSREQERIIRRMKRKEKRRGPIESYIEGILERNPQAPAWDIHKAIRHRFDIPITPNIMKQVRRKKKRLNEKLRRYRQKM